MKNFLCTAVIIILGIVPFSRAEDTADELDDNVSPTTAPVVKTEAVKAEAPKEKIEVSTDNYDPELAKRENLRESLRKEVPEADLVPALQDETIILPEPQSKNISRQDLIRRQRARLELKNEDLLTQKLEEARYKDEMKRTSQFLTGQVQNVTR